MKSALDRFKQLKSYIQTQALNVTVTLDGGITLEKISVVKEAGADAVAIDTAFFGAENKESFIEYFKSII